MLILIPTVVPIFLSDPSCPPCGQVSELMELVFDSSPPSFGDVNVDESVFIVDWQGGQKLNSTEAGTSGQSVG